MPSAFAQISDRFTKRVECTGVRRATLPTRTRDNDATLATHRYSHSHSSRRRQCTPRSSSPEESCTGTSPFTLTLTLDAGGRDAQMLRHQKRLSRFIVPYWSTCEESTHARGRANALTRRRLYKRGLSLLTPIMSNAYSPYNYWRQCARPALSRIRPRSHCSNETMSVSTSGTAGTRFTRGRFILYLHHFQ